MISHSSLTAAFILASSLAFQLTAIPPANAAGAEATVPYLAKPAARAAKAAPTPATTRPAAQTTPPAAPVATPPAAPLCSPLGELDNEAAQNPQDASLRLKQGTTHFDKGEFDCAIADFSKALALNPGDTTTNARALTLRAAAYAAKGAIDLAIADLSQAIELAPGQTAPYTNRGLLRAQKGEFGPAAEDFTESLGFEPINAKLYLNRGAAYAGLGDTARAIADFNRALEIEPASSAAHDNLGKVHLLKGELSPAMDEFSRAIELDPAQASPYFGRGNVYLAEGQSELAIADYSKAQSLDPANVQILTSRGSAYRAHGNFPLATADLTRAIALSPKYADAYYQLGYTHYFAKKYNDALKAFAKAAELTADPNAKFYSSFWAFAAKAKLGFKGQTVFNRVMAKMNPGLWPAPIAAIFQGSIAPTGLTAQVHAADPQKDAIERCQANFYLGEWYLMNGDPVNAATAFKAALAQNKFHLPEYEAAKFELRQLGEAIN